MSLFGEESNYNLIVSDELARERFYFLESMIEKYPDNTTLIGVYQQLIECFFDLEKSNLLSDKSIREKNIDLEKVIREEKLK